MNRKANAAIVVCILFIVLGCQYKKDLPDTSGDCSGITVSYSQQISPLIQTRCAVEACHNAISTNAGGPFTSYNLIKNKASTIRDQVVSGTMPQNSSLTAAEIKMIRCWVDSGAPDN